MRNFKQLFCSCAVMAFALASFNANAESVDATAARAAAGKFLQQNRTARFMNNSMSNIKLIHAEKSDVKDNAYYVFNIDGGGWVVIAGDDRANEVLAYGTEGNLDMNNLPDNMKGYMKRYKNQVEFLQSGKMKASSLKAPKRVQAVEPLLKSVNWAQQGPFNLECPEYNGERSSVGCAALAMAQVVYYWKYPNDFPAIGSYQNSYSFSYVPALPARTIDYNLIRDQYATWETGSLGYVPGVTQEEKQEVAWLCRYCAQACQMNFSPDGSGSNVLKQKNAFLAFGYNSNMRLLGIEAWPSRETWNTTDYSDDEWTAIMNEELAAGHPLPYSCEDFSIGHAFVVDGVDADGLYHVSWGWYGRGDGWFQHRAFNVTVQNEYMEFNDALFMVVDLYPYEGYVIPGGDEPEKKLGDINNDGFVNVSDVTDLISAILNSEVDSLDANVANINGDENINVSDVTALIAMILNN